MGARTQLGPADVDDDELVTMVRDQLGVADAELVSCRVDVVDYDLLALTTAGRYWVRGTARHADGESAYAFFVKVVQSWTRTPQFQLVPEDLRELAAAGLPWRVEPLVYGSDLARRLPAGLSLPRVHLVRDIDEGSACLWLQAVDADPAPWSTHTFERAAYLLGRLAASPAVEPVTRLGASGVVRGYASGRVQGQMLPVLRSDALWDHPLVAGAFGPDLRQRLLAAVDVLPALLDELDRAPLGTAHGDACTRNLLVPRDLDLRDLDLRDLDLRDRADDFVLVDLALWCRAPLGFDLSQLLMGEVQLGERPAAELPELEELCVAAYVRGLADEGCTVAPELVRRVHALVMLLFAGLSAVPLEMAYGLPAPGGPDVMRERAAAATFVLDLVDATSGT